MDKKKSVRIDAIVSPTLIGVINEMNKEGIKKDNIVTIFQNKEGMYVSVFYI